jgi:hypothetical protein
LSVPARNINTVIDSLIKRGYVTSVPQRQNSISFERESAIKYLQEKYKAEYWVNHTDPLRQAIGQVVYTATNNPFDSLKAFVLKYPFDSIDIPAERFYEWDFIKIRLPFLKTETSAAVNDSISVSDTLISEVTDSLNRNANTIKREVIVYRDTVVSVIRDTLYGVLPYRSNHLFNLYRYPYQSDSIYAAVRTLTDWIDSRDSSIIRFSSGKGRDIEVWRNSVSGKLYRYWLKNEYNDSVTVWVGPVGRNTIGLFIEEGIMFRRPSKQSNISDAQLTLKQINSTKLQDVNKVYVKPQYWKTRAEAIFVMNQALLTNWVKGGESSISTSMDITGFANYNNKKLLLSSSNFARIKYGLVKSGKDIRKNLDLIETNSKLNHKAFGKFDFSATLLFKTQLAKGYNYTKINGRDTALMVSKLFNPAVITMGLGLDYKPNKTTSINFSPLSYKGTFVTDTTGIIGLTAIDQTKYGIPKGKKSLHEPGMSLQFSNETKLWKNISITNRVQLFTNYIHNPLNIDIDWEMIATARLNWFTDVRLNTHFIFDDDTKTPVEGSQKKTARVQFKEILGFSFIFRF